MRILFVHQNFPGQFKHLAPALGQRGHEVVALGINPAPPLPHVKHIRYSPQRGSGKDTHPWVKDIETKVIRGEAAFQAARQLQAQGFSPDVIVAHPGWGESLFLKEVWPQARMGLYAEFFYRAQGADVGFDPEFAPSENTESCRIHTKNINNLMHFDLADAALSPTHWQASTFPAPFRGKITVAHDGIDTQVLKPDPKAFITLNKSLKIQAGDELITFVNRNLEPYRGFHIFMRALPRLLRERPQARVIIVGDNGLSYGSAPASGKSWKETMLAEVGDQCDLQRVHFVGKVAYPDFIRLLQVSMVHVYLTYPFVLSWSLLEAMSVGCAIVASDTRPLHEAIEHDVTGRLVPFFEPDMLTSEIVRLCNAPHERQRLGAAARAFAVQSYDLHSVCLPQQIRWVESLHSSVESPS